MYTELEFCRYCGSKSLLLILPLGNQFPSGFIPEDTLLDDSNKVPLELVQCNNCGLVQLGHNITLDLMYRQYWYSSALNKSMVSSLKDIIKSALKCKGHPHVVVDIGANDGTLLRLYDEAGMLSERAIKIGFDPALNYKAQAEKNCDYFINNYFSAKEYPIEEKADIITSIAMFYDLPDPKQFIEDIKLILKQDGIWIIQMTDLYSMLSMNAIDNCCVEHLEVYSLEVLNNMLEAAGLQIFDVSYNNVNGKSVRVFVSFKHTQPVSGSVFFYMKREKEFLASLGSEPFYTVYRTILLEQDKLMRFLQAIKYEKKKCFALGASTKGNTLLQLYGITNRLVPYALEVNPEKFGLLTAGSYLKIISEPEGQKLHPDYLLVLPWHFRDFLIEKYRNYIMSGGKLIFPLPYFEIVGKEYFDEH